MIFRISLRRKKQAIYSDNSLRQCVT